MQTKSNDGVCRGRVNTNDFDELLLGKSRSAKAFSAWNFFHSNPSCCLWGQLFFFFPPERRKGKFLLRDPKFDA